jgi:hypothetical protein
MEQNIKFKDIEKERVKKLPMLQRLIVKINAIKMVYWKTKSIIIL